MKRGLSSLCLRLHFSSFHTHTHTYINLSSPCSWFLLLGLALPGLHYWKRFGHLSPKLFFLIDIRSHFPLIFPNGCSEKCQPHLTFSRECLQSHGRMLHVRNFFMHNVHFPNLDTSISFGPLEWPMLR